MNVPTITMDPEQARAKLKAYRANVHKDAEEIYNQAAAGYAALAAGTPLLRLSQAIQSGGFFDDMRPKLAIAAADRREIHFAWRPNSMLASFDSDFANRPGRKAERTTVTVDMGREHGRTRTTSQGDIWRMWINGYALVPMIPADVRPAKGQLKDWFVLWEVDEWSDSPKTVRAPRDPLLLKRIGGDLFAVLAQWDLTPLEQAILEGAMRS